MSGVRLSFEDERTLVCLRLRHIASDPRRVNEGGPTELQRAQARMCADMMAHDPPYIVGEPTAEDARAASDDLYKIADIVDGLVREVGAEHRRCFGSKIDLDNYDGKLHDAFDGNATSDLEDVAGELENAELPDPDDRGD